MNAFVPFALSVAMAFGRMDKQSRSLTVREGVNQALAPRAAFCRYLPRPARYPVSAPLELSRFAQA